MMKPSIIPTLFILFLSLLMIGCTSPSKEVKEESKPPVAAAPSYPSMSNEEITQLHAKAEKVDMIFYNLPMSVNQDDAKSAKNTVLYISPAPALMQSQCKPLGRLSWMANGAIIKEADIYCDAGCQYFIFMKDNKPEAANAMSESGVVFFNNIITQAAQQRPQ